MTRVNMLTASLNSRTVNMKPLKRGSMVSPQAESTVSLQEDKAVEAKWIPINLKRRECVRYCESSDPGICACGRKKDAHHTNQDHVDAPSGANTGEWSMENDTTLCPSNAFGEIDFEDKNSRAKFVRVDYQTSMRTMQVLLTDIWRINRPNLLISVTGGAKRLTLNPRLMQTFKDGLMRAAASTGALIITAGTSSGVVKVVGQAVHEYTLANGINSKPVVIGIAPWGLVQDTDYLTSTNGCWPACYNPDVRSRKSREYPLDSDHSHFILVDDGTISRYSPAEAEFRAELESAIAKIGTQVAYSQMKVPLVLLVLEGGAGCLETVENALKYKTSVVVVAGSGRAADVLAFAYENTTEVEGIDNDGNIISIVAEMEGAVADTLLDMIKKEFLTDETRAASILQIVQNCMTHRPYLTVFRIDDGQDIDQAMLHALLKVNKQHSIHQLRLALAWNRIDIARSDIFTEGRSWRAEDIEEALFLSLIDDKEEFVRLLLEPSATDIGIDLKRFLTIERLCKIYNTLPKGCLLETLLLERCKKHELYTLEDIGLVLQHLMGAWYRPLYLTDLRYRQVRVERVSTEEDGGIIKTKFDALTVPLKGGKFSDHRKKATAGKTSTSQSTMVNGSAKKPIIPLVTAEKVSILNAAPPSERGKKATAGKGSTIGRDRTTRKVTTEDYRRHYRLVRWEKERAHDFDRPFMELFIWAILLHRRELAELCWEEGKLGMAGAVVAERLLASLKKETDNADKIRQIDAILQSFNEKGVGVLSHCHTLDQNKAAFLLIRVMPRFGETTVMQLVAEANVNFTFITHAACQSLVRTIWFGHIAHETSTFLILLSVICPPFLFGIQYRHRDLKHIMYEKREQERQKDTTIVVKTSGGPKSAGRQADVQNAPVWKRPYYFFSSPLVIFIYTQIMYTIFLLLFAITLMTNFYPDHVSRTEYIIYFWVFTICCEELRQFVGSDLEMDLRSLCARYFADTWNIVDVVAIFLFILGVALRWAGCQSCHEYARLAFALDSIVWSCRILHAFTIDRRLGPKLVMIGYMLRDLLSFIGILLLFVVAYGVALQAIMYPNSELQWTLIIDVIRKAYWQIYGELFLNELELDDMYRCTYDPVLYGNGTLARCPDTHWYVPVLLGVYIMLTNVLMLNLLIAMFSYTFDKIQQETDLHWYFQRYFLVKEFGRRPILVPPFIFFSHIFALLRSIVSCFRRCNINLDEDDDDEDDMDNMRNFKVRLSEKEDDELTMWERVGMYEYIRETQKAAQVLKQRNQREREAYDKILSMEKTMGKQMQTLEEQLKRMATGMNWLIQNTGTDKSGRPPPIFEETASTMPDTASRARSSRRRLKRVESKHEGMFHEQARTHKYPTIENKVVYRFIVPDSKVPWQVEWPEYAPEYYVSETVLNKGPNRVDAENLQELDVGLPFNEMDEERRVDRRSHCGPYRLVDGRPLNPMGRTGISGRGNQQRWGPNHAIDPVVTRWCRNYDGNLVKEAGRHVLEFVAVRRVDAAQWAIPGGYLTGRDLVATMKSTFLRKALPGCANDPDILQAVDQLFRTGKEVYRGYSDDPRNTDNAWMESVAYNFHDSRGDLVEEFPFRAGDRVDLVCWLKISSQIKDLYAGHYQILKYVAELHDAAF